MKIIISPAKKMKVETEVEHQSMPLFLDKTQILMSYLQGLGYEESKRLWKCNDKITLTNRERLTDLKLTNNLTPAILAYEGIQYTYMAPQVFEKDQWNYIVDHLSILSGFYGILRPLDGIVPYRLEMQAVVQLSGYKDLYDYWGDSLSDQLYEDTDIVLNLASKEYSRCIERYLTTKRRFITCTFGEYQKGKITTKGTYAKMARGEMVRFLAENRIDDLAGVKDFNRLGFRYHPGESSDKNIVFIKDKEEHNVSGWD
ncbi:MAG: hypothetical protein K0R46_3085 [Herbinix sp.]|nr:hypothetical protein [Herbinix sp.]